MNSGSEREPSSGENSTSSVKLGCATAAHLALDVLACDLQLVFDVDVAGGQERMDARALGVPDGVPCGVDVLARAGQAQMTGPSTSRAIPGRTRSRPARRSGSRPRSRRRRAARAGGRSPASPLVQRDAGRLFAVAQRRVEDQYAVLRSPASRCLSCLPELLMPFASPSLARFACLSPGFAARRPPRAIPPEGEQKKGVKEARCSNDICLRRVAPHATLRSATPGAPSEYRRGRKCRAGCYLEAPAVSIRRSPP